MRIKNSADSERKVGVLSATYYREVPGVMRPASRYSIGIRLARIIHDGSSAPTLPSPIAWGRVREGVRGRRPETDHRFTIHASRFLGAGRERHRWSRIVRRSRRVGVGQAPGGKALVQDEEQSGLLPPYKRQYLSVLGSFV